MKRVLGTVCSDQDLLSLGSHSGSENTGQGSSIMCRSSLPGRFEGLGTTETCPEHHVTNDSESSDLEPNIHTRSVVQLTCCSAAEEMLSPGHRWQRRRQSILERMATRQSLQQNYAEIVQAVKKFAQYDECPCRRKRNCLSVTLPCSFSGRQFIGGRGAPFLDCVSPLLEQAQQHENSSLALRDQWKGFIEAPLRRLDASRSGCLTLRACATLCERHIR